MPDEIFATLNIVDLGFSDAYLQILGNSYSEKLLVMNTHISLLQSNRLPLIVEIIN